MGRILEFFKSRDIHDIFEYKDGALYWKLREVKHFTDKNFNSKCGGKKAGNIMQKGYWRIRYQYTFFQEHRLIYFMFTGQEPQVVDHIDGNPLNNSIENLRAADIIMNARNIKGSKNNKSGYANIRLSKSGKYSVHVSILGKQIMLGTFKNIHEAIKVRDEFKKVHGYTNRYKNNER